MSRVWQAESTEIHVCDVEIRDPERKEGRVGQHSTGIRMSGEGSFFEASILLFFTNTDLGVNVRVCLFAVAILEQLASGRCLLKLRQAGQDTYYHVELNFSSLLHVLSSQLSAALLT